VYLERTASKTLVSLCNRASRSSSYSAAFISSTTFLSGFALLLDRFTATRVWANDYSIKICLPWFPSMWCNCVQKHIWNKNLFLPTSV
jgi:hypothetical protein